jgi:hypothetical protein
MRGCADSQLYETSRLQTARCHNSIMLLYVYIHLFLALSSALVSRRTRRSLRPQIGSRQRDLIPDSRRYLLKDGPDEMPQTPYDPYSSPVASNDDSIAIPPPPGGYGPDADPLTAQPGQPLGETQTDGSQLGTPPIAGSNANIPLQPTAPTDSITIDPFVAVDGNGNWHKSGSSETAPEEQQLQPQFYQTSRRVKIRYGPFKVGSATDFSLEMVLNANEGVFDFVKVTAKKPCSDCILTYAAPGLEFADGSEANTDSGIWLRGLSIVNNAHTDLVCTLWRERIFEASNERIPVMFSDINNPTMRTGYHVGTKDTFGVQAEILNMNSSQRTVYITVIWEYIPSRPSGWRRTRSVFLDLTKCNMYPGVPMKAEAKSNYAFGPWKSTVQGKILSASKFLNPNQV